MKHEFDDKGHLSPECKCYYCRFKVPLHVSEREEQSEAQAGAGEISQKVISSKVGLDTMLDCVELTKETLQ